MQRQAGRHGLGTALVTLALEGHEATPSHASMTMQETFPWAHADAGKGNSWCMAEYRACLGHATLCSDVHAPAALPMCA